METDKDIYRQLRQLSCQQLEEQEIPGFDQASPRERLRRVSLIRAVGVVFSARGTPQQRESIRAWLRRLLQDPEEKIRRYALAALPKVGASEGEEDALLALLQSTQLEREKKFLERALSKIGGQATLEVAAQSCGLLSQSEQKVRANRARQQSPSSIRLDVKFAPLGDLRIKLRCRRGLEGVLGDEANDAFSKYGTFRIVEIQEACVTLHPVAPFSLANLYTLRCFATASFVLGTFPESRPDESTEAIANALTSALARDLFHRFTDGSIRYRLDFIGGSQRRKEIAQIADRAFALCPEILNDARQAPWVIEIHPLRRGQSVELRPKLTPDPRLGYRQNDIPASSHPPLAAALARLAGRQSDEIVWDPFCGSGLELIESALLGGVKKLYGTDLSETALTIAQANVIAAQLAGIETHFTRADFREHSRIPGLGPRSVSLIITNPPMGRRLRIPNLRGLISDLFAVAAMTLRPGGRLVFVNPLKFEPDEPTLRRVQRLIVDLGGFNGRIEIYQKSDDQGPRKRSKNS